jgi:hypothetical protein
MFRDVQKYAYYLAIFRDGTKSLLDYIDKDGGVNLD